MLHDKRKHYQGCVSTVLNFMIISRMSFFYASIRVVCRNVKNLVYLFVRKKPAGKFQNKYR